ncbi:hypothetical protein D9619_011610 [Psilocybe cf. subviscida]|uniref:Nephrocystin 3-like N-terminal domain-containing protein n=1 Tax=Psilocybe cf. subviscida TaxID=2480587 RepID=A0A8H5BT69_9AGAR|nr:hypothetical protein D9619_011610 [Psilocybe cf. subviscida]
MFTNAKNFSILGGNFTVNTRDEETHGIAQVMNMLKIHISPSAMHDSAVRSDVPKCHEDTRVAIVQKICVWRLSAGRPFLWMYGPAGCGKTTIAQTIAEKFDNDGTLAASFFFSRSAPGRPTSKDQFVATIAYQLCLALPNFHSHISPILRDNPAIFNKTLSKQADELIIKPLKAFAALHTNAIFTPRVILIDGLDECAPSESQKEILDVMAHCQRQSSFPLKFLISSRPEAIIRTRFSHGSLGPLTEGLPLDNDYRAQSDIYVFVISKFNEIRENHPAGPDLPSGWPSDADVQHMVKKSSGHFIYISVAMKYISEIHRHPIHSLKDIIGLSSSKSAPFSDLDALYIHCLSSVPPRNLDYVLDIFLWMTTGVNTTACFEPEYDHPSDSPMTKSLHWADRLFGGRMLGITRTHLDGLHSIVYVPNNGTEELAFFHASFSDFLYDQSRLWQDSILRFTTGAIPLRHYLLPLSLFLGQCSPDAELVRLLLDIWQSISLDGLPSLIEIQMSVPDDKVHDFWTACSTFINKSGVSSESAAAYIQLPSERIKMPATGSTVTTKTYLSFN